MAGFSKSICERFKKRKWGNTQKIKRDQSGYGLAKKRHSETYQTKSKNKSHKRKKKD